MEFGSIKLIHPVEDPRLFTKGKAKLNIRKFLRKKKFMIKKLYLMILKSFITNFK